MNNFQSIYKSNCKHVILPLIRSFRYWKYVQCDSKFYYLDLWLIPGLGRSPGEGNGNPLQYSRLENPMDRGAWRATVQGVAESDTTKWRSTQIFAIALQCDTVTVFSASGSISTTQLPHSQLLFCIHNMINTFIHDLSLTQLFFLISSHSSKRNTGITFLVMTFFMLLGFWTFF